VLDAEQASNPITRALLERRLATVDDLAMSFDPTSARGVDVKAPYPGRYRASFRVQDVETGREVGLEGGEAVEIVVVETTEPQPFVLRPDAAALRAACERSRAAPR
jgi:hypothetical protein